MGPAFKWLISWAKRHPALAIAVAGIWLAAIPVSFDSYVLDRRIALRKSWLDAQLFRIHDLPYAAEVAGVFFLGGCIIGCFGTITAMWCWLSSVIEKWAGRPPL